MGIIGHPPLRDRAPCPAAEQLGLRIDTLHALFPRLILLVARHEHTPLLVADPEQPRVPHGKPGRRRENDDHLPEARHDPDGSSAVFVAVMVMTGSLMRRTSPLAGLLVALFTSVGVGVAQISSEDLERSARATITANSSDYLAAIVRPARKATCKNHGTETICLQPMMIVELIGGEKHGQPWPRRDLKISVFAGRTSPPPSRSDERSLIIAIPSKNAREAYVMSQVGPATPEDVAAVRRATGDHGRWALKCQSGTTYLVSNGNDSTCVLKQGVSVRCDDRHGNHASAACASGCQAVGGHGSCTIPDERTVNHGG